MRILKNIEKSFLEKRAEKLYSNFQKDIKGEKILDFGCGWGSFTNLLRKKKYKVTPVDITNKSLYSSIKPLVYNGKDLNFPKKKFDTAIVITVLHHTPNPEYLLSRISEISKRIILIEDIYNNNFHKEITKFFDSISNGEWKGHPHSNKSDFEWRNTFNKLNLKLLKNYSQINAVVFKHGYYVIE